MNDPMPLKILVIEDDPAILSSYDAFLEDLDFCVFTAKNGKEGIEIITKEKLDIVLTDMRMPVMDGLQVLDWVNENYSKLPIIVISGAGDINIVVEALRLGAWDYIIKPITNMSVLEHSINRALEKSRLIKENEEYQQHLEQLVEKRTRKLDHALGVLKKKNKELEISRKQAQESNQLKTAFLQNISHEIRTPLNGIIGFIDILLDSKVPQDDCLMYFNEMKENSERLLLLLNNIIDLAIIEAGQLSLRISDVNILSILKESYAYFKDTASKSNLSFTYQHSIQQEQLTIKSDAVKVLTTLNILIDNAIKFTRNGYVKFGCDKVDNELRFYVKDSGVGIKPNMLSKIFEKFRQDDTINNTNPYDGAGVGLSIANAYIKALGGNIEVESKENKGSTFYFTIPIN